MRQRGFRFEFEVPDNWRASRDGNRFVYHRPQGGELIVSGVILEGEASESEVVQMHDALLRNVIDSMSESAAHSDLVTVKALREDQGAVTPPLKCWTLHSHTRAEDVLFSQAAVSSGTGILLVTLEAPNVPDALSTYRRILKGIRVAKSD